MDFFGGFNGTGPYSQQQPTPRLRQAYMDLTNPESGTTVRIGQQWDLMFPIDNSPTSLAHIAFPLGFGSGYGGWRFPGVVVMQDLNHGSTGPQWRLDVGAFEGRSEEHTSELQSLMRISYAVFCLKKKNKKTKTHIHISTCQRDSIDHNQIVIT